MISPQFSFHFSKVRERNPTKSKQRDEEPQGRTHGRAAVREGVHADGAAHLVGGEGRWGRAALVQLLLGRQVLALQVLPPCSLDAAAKKGFKNIYS